MSWLYSIIYIVFVLFCLSQTLYPILMLGAMLFRQSKQLYSFFHQVDKTSTKNGGELVAEIIKSHGIKNIFTLPGGHVSPISVGAEKLNIKVIDVRHEATAVFAADAHARISGIPGVAVVTAGPGLTNTVTAIKNAQLAESPVVVIAGAAATMLKGRGSLQDIDQMSLLKSVTKKCFTVDCVREIIPTMREAFRLSQVGIPGPVFVELPIDTLYPYSIISQQFKQMSKSDPQPNNLPRKPKSLWQKVIELYSEYKINNIFADAFISCDTDPMPIYIKSPSSSEVSKVVDLLKKAQRPLIIAGSQCIFSPVDINNIASQLKQLNIPIYVNGSARGLMGYDYELQFRHARKEAVRGSDLVILLGVMCDFRLLYGRIFDKSTKIVAVNKSSAQAKLNAGIFWNPEMVVESDIGKFLDALTTKLKSDQTSPASALAVDQVWLESLKKRDSDKEISIQETAIQPANKYLNPIGVLTRLRKTLEEQARVLGEDNSDYVLIADGGDFVATASYILKPSKPLRWLDPGPFGTLGCGAGFALAAKLLLPKSKIICIMGDGAFGYAIPELDTFVRHKLPTYWLIGNDACWTQILREQVVMLKSEVACNLDYTNYDKVAEGFGAIGFKLSDESHLNDIKTSLETLDKKNQTVVVNALIGKTSFREGSISV